MDSYDEYGNYNMENDYASSTDESYSIQISRGTKRKQGPMDKLMEEMKKLDKGYRKVTRNIKGKLTDVEFYTTSTTPGTLIRDAVTGSRYTHYRVGSSDESLFFKVRIAIGGKEYKDEPTTLFFDNPETYERVLGSVVKQEDKEAWIAKNTMEVVSRA